MVPIGHNYSESVRIQIAFLKNPRNAEAIMPIVLTTEEMYYYSDASMEDLKLAMGGSLRWERGPAAPIFAFLQNLPCFQPKRKMFSCHFTCFPVHKFLILDTCAYKP